MSEDGFFVREEGLADKIQIGPLVLTNVPVAEVFSNGIEGAWGSEYDGNLGMAALSHLDVIADGVHDTAYFRLRKAAPPPYSYNRLGAVFWEFPGHPHEASARVLPGSPAYDAGIRDGDVFVEVEAPPQFQRDFNRWMDQFDLPAGTKLRFTLQRNGTNFETVATLRDILKPKSGG